VNDQDITAYLDAPYIAVVATISRNGAPHLTPNWYRYDGKVLTLITRTDRLKYFNLQRDHHEVDAYLARWKTEPRVLITVTPERISTRAARRR
jgi:nitroimidazol reductase NimA-like FMN-containing flavoprotein (pyridoxamine 5'-phosphate oxidase superfamily)